MPASISAIESQGVVQASYRPPSAEEVDRFWADADSVHRLIDAVKSLSDGTIPALGSVDAPPAPDEVLVCRDRDGRLVVAPGTQRRFDRIVEAFEAFDVEAFSASLDDLGERWVEISPEGPGFREALSTAIDQLLDFEPPEVEPDMVSKGTHWGFADPEYENLSAAQQQLLLMGRRNARIVRARFEEIRDLVGPVAVDTGPSPAPDVEEEILIAEEAPDLDATAEVSPK